LSEGRERNPTTEDRKRERDRKEEGCHPPGGRKQKKRKREDSKKKKKIGRYTQTVVDCLIRLKKKNKNIDTPVAMMEEELDKRRKTRSRKKSCLERSPQY